MTTDGQTDGQTDTQGDLRVLLERQPTSVGVFPTGCAISDSIGVMVHIEEIQCCLSELLPT